MILKNSIYTGTKDNYFILYLIIGLRNEIKLFILIKFEF
jgi:hypothetical protein